MSAQSKVVFVNWLPPHNVLNLFSLREDLVCARPFGSFIYDKTIECYGSGLSSAYDWLASESESLMVQLENKVRRIWICIIWGLRCCVSECNRLMFVPCRFLSLVYCFVNWQKPWVEVRSERSWFTIVADDLSWGTTFDGVSSECL